MNYTIVSLDDVQGSITVDLMKDGNKYYVDLWDSGKKIGSQSPMFDNIDDAWDRFKEVAEAVAKSLFTTEQKIKILKGEI